MKEAVIFDLDGTLWDSSRNVALAWNSVFRKYGIERRTDRDEIRYNYTGRTLNDIGVILFPDMPDSERKAVMADCVEAENELIAKNGGMLYSGVEKVLSELKRRYFVALVSNCQESYLNVFFKTSGLSCFFDDSECNGRTGLPKADNIRLVTDRNDIQKAVYIGDTVWDKEAADTLGIPFIHASYGFGKLDSVFSAADISDFPRLCAHIFDKNF